MRFIQIIFAFVSVYLCISVFIVLISFFSWMNTFHINSQNEPMQIVKTNLDNATIYIMENKSNSALLTLLKLSKMQTVSKVAETSGTTLFIMYEKGSVDASLVPLGFTTLFRISSISDQNGKKIYVAENSILDVLARKVFARKITWSNEILPIVASSQSKSYTVKGLADGIKLYED